MFCSSVLDLKKTKKNASRIPTRNYPQAISSVMCVSEKLKGFVLMTHSHVHQLLRSDLPDYMLLLWKCLREILCGKKNPKQNTFSMHWERQPSSAVSGVTGWRNLCSHKLKKPCWILYFCATCQNKLEGFSKRALDMNAIHAGGALCYFERINKDITCGNKREKIN